MKVKFLSVIWGPRYIREFAMVSLPSYLAPGNLPYLAKQTDLEILILTSKASRAAFDREPIFQKLEALCSVRFIYIDDLITTGNYGVTLTLAYTRGILDSGPEQTSTYFVFMNSDFVLADGALTTLVGRLREGEVCIMAPSLRARSEAVVPALVDAVDTAHHALAMPPRKMVKLAFENLHPTVIAKTITQRFITCTTHNQIYWHVDDRTLIGRYHLLFMLAIKPEVPMTQANSYCDYGFVPELVPSGDFSILGDSDEFFMLELQPTDQEKMYLRAGVSTLDEMAAHLSTWTTHEHRQFAKRDAVFHTDDLSAGLDQYRKAATNLITRLHAKMSKRPVSHIQHHFWTGGVFTWLSSREQRFHNLEDLHCPPELKTLSHVSPRKLNFHNRINAMVRALIMRLYRSSIIALGKRRGKMPFVALWHNLWLDSQLVLGWAQRARANTNGRNLLIHEANSDLREPLQKTLLVDNVAIEDLLNAEACPGPAYDNILVHVHRANVHKTSKVLDIATTLVAPAGSIAIFIEHSNFEVDPNNFSNELPWYIEDILHSQWMAYEISASFVGGRFKRFLRKLERALLGRLGPPTGFLDVPIIGVAAIGWSMVALIMALNNLRMRDANEICPPYCSSALVSLTKRTKMTECGLRVGNGREDQHSTLEFAVDTT